MKTIEIKKAEPLILVDLIDYESKNVVIKPIFKKTTLDMSIIAIDVDKELEEQILPFDRVMQVIDGVAEIIINGKSQILNSSQAIIIPPHTSFKVKAKEPVKLLLTILKSGYEI